MNLDENIKKACQKYQNLCVSLSENGYILTGKIILNAEYNKIPLYDEYYLEIFIPYKFPNEMPYVKDIGGNIPKSINHFYDNGALCLGANCEIIDFITKNSSVTEFIDVFVINFLYIASYFDRYASFPYGERSHGVKGIEEAYLDRYNCQNRELLMKLLLYVSGIIQFRGHLLCPCESGKKFRACHGKKVLEDLKSDYSNCYKRDAYYILQNYLNEKKRKSR